jgi:hypothetical protein
VRQLVPRPGPDRPRGNSLRFAHDPPALVPHLIFRRDSRFGWVQRPRSRRLAEPVRIAGTAGTAWTSRSSSSSPPTTNGYDI